MSMAEFVEHLKDKDKEQVEAQDRKSLQMQLQAHNLPVASTVRSRASKSTSG